MTWYIFEPGEPPYIAENRIGPCLVYLHAQAHLYHEANNVNLHAIHPPSWYSKYLTPVRIEDVPKEYRLMLAIIK